MGLDFRTFDSSLELENQRKLFKECFPETLSTPVSSKKHYFWKFHSKNGMKVSQEYGAYSEDGLIGYYAGIPYQYKYNEKEFTAAMVCDVMTGIKARGKGVFTKLGIYSTENFGKNGFDFSTGFPIRKEVIPGHLKAGWQVCFELPLYGKFIKFNSFLSQKKLTYLTPLLNFGLLSIDLLFKILRPRIKKEMSIVRFSSNTIGEICGLEEFYLKWANQVKISLIKDLEFLKWRLGAPEKEYKIITLRAKKDIVGVIIAREIMKEGVPCFGILDLAMLDGYHKYSSLLINELGIIAKEEKIEMFLMMMSNYRFKEARLARQLFFKSPFRFQFILKKLNPSINIEILKDKRNWSLMWLDSDDL